MNTTSDDAAQARWHPPPTARLRRSSPDEAHSPPAAIYCWTDAPAQQTDERESTRCSSDGQSESGFGSTVGGEGPRRTALITPVNPYILSLK